jgi:D-sedoheptulose 7-phosphate isomerase
MSLENRLKEYVKPADYAKSYFGYLSEIFSKIDTNQIAQFIETILDARERGARVFFIGNGGSAATASHFANDLSVGTRSKGKPFKVISLSDNAAVMTAIGNDYGYEFIFQKQLQALMEPGDVVVAISASGNSPNLVTAFEYANQMKATTVALTGFDGGKLKQMATYAVHVPSNKGEYGPVEDLHMIFDHVVYTYISNICKNA